jgi:hypothetical protein
MPKNHSSRRNTHAIVLPEARRANQRNGRSVRKGSEQNKLFNPEQSPAQGNHRIRGASPINRGNGLLCQRRLCWPLLLAFASDWLLLPVLLESPLSTAAMDWGVRSKSTAQLEPMVDSLLGCRFSTTRKSRYHP